MNQEDKKKPTHLLMTEAVLYAASENNPETTRHIHNLLEIINTYHKVTQLYQIELGMRIPNNE